MKTFVMIALFLLATRAAAAWRDLKEGLEPKAVIQFVGTPLFANQTRGGTWVTWTYDNGGYVMFEGGRVRYWQAPRAAPR